MVCYGEDNNGQSYGGGIVYCSRYISKPCFLDIIDHDNVVKGIVYILFYGSLVRYYRQSGNIVLRVLVYGR